MPVLHNQISNKILKERMLAETEPRTTISFINILIFKTQWRFAMNGINSLQR